MIEGIREGIVSAAVFIGSPYPEQHSAAGCSVAGIIRVTDDYKVFRADVTAFLLSWGSSPVLLFFCLFSCAVRFSMRLSSCKNEGRRFFVFGKNNCTPV